MLSRALMTLRVSTLSTMTTDSIVNAPPMISGPCMFTSTPMIAGMIAIEKVAAAIW